MNENTLRKENEIYPSETVYLEIFKEEPETIKQQYSSTGSVNTEYFFETTDTMLAEIYDTDGTFVDSISLTLNDLADSATNTVIANYFVLVYNNTDVWKKGDNYKVLIRWTTGNGSIRQVIYEGEYRVK